VGADVEGHQATFGESAAYRFVDGSMTRPRGVHGAQGRPPVGIEIADQIEKFVTRRLVGIERPE